jgi:hypothetical protein
LSIYLSPLATNALRARRQKAQCGLSGSAAAIDKVAGGTSFPPPHEPRGAPLTRLRINRVTDTLIRIGNLRGVAVFSIDPYTLSDTSDVQLYAAYAWTSAGKLAVSYTVTSSNRETGSFWVQLTSYRRTW